jgi:hypothetical protein
VEFGGAHDRAERSIGCILHNEWFEHHHHQQ